MRYRVQRSRWYAERERLVQRIFQREVQRILTVYWHHELPIRPGVVCASETEQLLLGNNENNGYVVLDFNIDMNFVH